MSVEAAATRQRLEILDLARGVGFLLVLFRHCVGFISGALLSRIMPQDATILDFFFVLSGFCAGYAYDAKLRDGDKTAFDAIVERYLRLFPMVALGTVFGAILFWTQKNGETAAGDTAALFALLKGVFLIPTHAVLDWRGPPTLFPLDVPLWFLCYDTAAYLLFLLVLRFLPTPLLVATAIMSAWGLCLGAIAHNNIAFGADWRDWIYASPRCLCGFTIGYLIFRVHERKMAGISNLHSLAPILLLLVLVFIPISGGWRFSGELQAVIALFAMPLIVFWAARAPATKGLSSLAKLSSRLSLAVYALHFPIVRALSGLRWKYHMHGGPGLALLVAEFLVVMLVAYFATLYIDEPLRDFLSSKLREKRARTPVRAY